MSAMGSKMPMSEMGSGIGLAGAIGLAIGWAEAMG